MRMDPPPSVPRASGPSPAATAAPAPELEPPGVMSGCQGLRVAPKSGLSARLLWPNSGVLVLPRITAPAALSRSTAIASSSGTKSAKMREPPVVTIPRVKRTSLMDTGTPCTAPSGSPCMMAASAIFAPWRATSAVTAQKALSVGFSRSMRASSASVSSTGESFLARMRAASSIAGSQQRALIGAPLPVELAHVDQPGDIGLSRPDPDPLVGVRDKRGRDRHVGERLARDPAPARARGQRQSQRERKEDLAAAVEHEPPVLYHHPPMTDPLRTVKPHGTVVIHRPGPSGRPLLVSEADRHGPPPTGAERDDAGRLRPARRP